MKNNKAYSWDRERAYLYPTNIWATRHIRNTNSKNYAKKEIHRGSSSKGHRYGFRARKPKLSINLNRPAPEEIPYDLAKKTIETLTPKEYEAIIVDLRQQNQKLVVQNLKYFVLVIGFYHGFRTTGGEL